MKFCKDCKHCDRGKNDVSKHTLPGDYPGAHWLCHYYRQPRLDVVTGETYNAGAAQPCSRMREDYRDCGQEARLFEPRT